jgi:hypothetical protein
MEGLGSVGVELTAQAEHGDVGTVVGHSGLHRGSLSCLINGFSG